MTSPRPSWLAHRRWPTFSEIKVFRWSISTSSKRKIHLCPHLPSLLSFLGGRSDYRLGFQGQLFHWCPGSVPYLPSGVRVCVCIICYFSHIIFKSWYVVFSSLFNSRNLLFLGCEACRILVPWPGIEPAPHEMEVRKLNTWTTRGVSGCVLNGISHTLPYTSNTFLLLSLKP